tara:strand:+ start:21036 stop:22052 length:1017 start_codon:yes stop_codon:yes gene_type:complete
MFNVGLIGGTFDRFHIGHHHLISKSLEFCNELEIWINSDYLAQKKDPRVLPWDDRRDNILDFLDEELVSRVSFGKLEDEYGPALDHLEAQVIFCTEDNKETCDRINKLRIENKLAPLEVVILKLQKAWDDVPISSSRIRDGEIDSEGRSWLPSSVGVNDLFLTKAVESNLKDPFGILIEGPEDNPEVAMRLVLNEINGYHGPLIAVGDVTVKTLQDIGHCPDIALIDERTKREFWSGTLDIDENKYDNVINCKNKAGLLSVDLFESCKTAISNWSESKQSTIIRVDGEEDLAPLLLHPLAPLGAVILYGQPGKGVVVRYTGIDSKSRCRELLSYMIGK